MMKILNDVPRSFSSTSLPPLTPPYKGGELAACSEKRIWFSEADSRG